jgi:signal transduction histidine kinase
MRLSYFASALEYIFVFVVYDFLAQAGFNMVHPHQQNLVGFKLLRIVKAMVKIC